MERCRALLRSNFILADKEEQLYCMQLPSTVMKEVGWSINDTIVIDVIKSGINISIQLKKDEKAVETSKDD
tara:strand:+ start:6694 stop:6906 length:213 start_codon:yes stop_codon:yes gene_type:complete